MLPWRLGIEFTFIESLGFTFVLVFVFKDTLLYQLDIGPMSQATQPWVQDLSDHPKGFQFWVDHPTSILVLGSGGFVLFKDSMCTPLQSCLPENLSYHILD